VLIAIRSSLPFLVAAAASLMFTPITAGCQAATPLATAASPAIQLRPYTTPDQSASASVPSGWQVTSGQRTAIVIAGPQGEIVNLGGELVARNAPYQPGQRAANGIDLSMPFAATLPQKLAIVLQHGAEMSGKSFSQFTITSATPLQLPPTVGQCGRFVAGFSNQQGPMKVMGVFCSLPLDTGGTYKLIWMLAQAPAAVAAQSAPTAQAIFSSYRIPSAWLQRVLAPYTPPPPRAVPMLPGMGSATALGAGVSNSANCFDLEVLRQTPKYLLPKSCGGNQPD
jgi:hypothetical protein